MNKWLTVNWVRVGKISAPLLLLAGLISLSSFEPAPVESGERSIASERPRRKHGHRCDHVSKNCFKETYQAPDTTTGAVDVLFVVNTTDSAAAERAAVAPGIQNFIGSLPETADVNVAVLLAHGVTSAQSGVLYQADAEPVVLKGSELSNSDIQAGLNLKLTQVQGDPDSGGGVEGFFSLFHLITTPALLTDAQNAGFFRSGAALAVVFISDVRDLCAIVPAGVPPETDPVKLAARVRDCEGLTAQGLTSRLKALKGADPLVVSGIIYADEPVPADGPNEIGYGYTDIIALNNGVAIDIANDDIAQGLAAIGELAGQAMGGQQTYTLSHTGVDPATLKVQVNGQDVPYQLVGDVVTLTQPVPAGAVIVISYCIKSTEQGHCRGDHHRKYHRHEYHRAWEQRHEHEKRLEEMRERQREQQEKMKKKIKKQIEKSKSKKRKS